jgi:hypothetical protein
MNLTQKEFEDAKKIMEASLKLNLNDIEKHLNEAVATFKSNLNIYDIDDRYKVFTFLDHISTLYLNIMENGDKYLLGKKEEERATKGREIISKIFKNFREDGI